MRRKITAALLALLMLCTIAACGESASAPAVTAAEDPSAEISETEAAETEPAGDKPEITEADYGGAAFNILYPTWSLYNNFYFAEENNGEAVNDAIFERTQKIEESLNIDIVPQTLGYIDTVYPAVNKTVMAGEDAYQLALTHCATSLVSYVSQEVVVNWNKIPNIDMTKSYWNQSLSGNMEVSGVLPFNVNSFILPDVNSIFFNTQLYENFIGDDLYSYILDGKWTWDRLIETAGKASLDIDGDGQFTDKDQYGFVGEMGWQFASVLTSCDQYMISVSSDEGAYVSLYSDKTINLIDKVRAMLHDGNTGFTWNYDGKYDPNQGGTPPVSFNDGKAMYYLVPLSLASTFRAMDTDFGIVPLPKYDENQEKYVTLNWSGFMCVPLTVGDLEMAGCVIENLGWLNDEKVVPAFYDILLGQKIARNEESIRMLDIIFEDSVYDLGVGLGIYDVFGSCVSAKKPVEFASYYEKNLKTWNKKVTEYTDACAEYAADLG